MKRGLHGYIQILWFWYFILFFSFLARSDLFLSFKQRKNNNKMYDKEMCYLMKSVVYSAQSWIPVLNDGAEACSTRHGHQDPAGVAVTTHS